MRKDQPEQPKAAPWRAAAHRVLRHAGDPLLRAQTGFKGMSSVQFGAAVDAAADLQRKQGVKA